MSLPQKNNLSLEELKSILENTAIRYLSFRPRFKAEVVNRLATKAIELQIKDPIALIDQITQSLEKSGFLNDSQLLESFIRNKLQNKFKGPYWIRPRLAHFGLLKSEIDVAMKKFATKEIQLEVLKTFIAKKLKAKSLDLPLKMRLYRLLAGRGFGQDVIGQAFDLDGQLE